MESEAGRLSLQRIWDSVPLQPWSTNVHRHWEAVQRHVSQAVFKAFPSRRGSCRSSHFSTATWMIRQRRVWLQRRILRARHFLRNFELTAAFQAWSASRRFGLCAVAAALRCGFWHLDLLHVTAELRRTKTELRQAVRQDRGVRIEEAARQAAILPTSQTVAALRPLLGPPKRRQRASQGLPMVLREDGLPAASLEEAEEVWLRHFAGIEDGHVIEPEVLAAKCLARQQARDLTAFTVARAEFPTRNELEASLRAVQVGRAAGTDGLPGEFLAQRPAPFFSWLSKSAYGWQSLSTLREELSKRLGKVNSRLRDARRIGVYWFPLVWGNACIGS